MNAKTNQRISGSTALLLVVLMCENCASMLARRYAVGVLRLNFNKSSVLLVNETMKLFVSVVATIYFPPAQPHPPAEASHGVKKIKLVLQHSFKMAVPAAVYLIVNLISYPALERIDASVFTAISQLKVLATAICAVLMLSSHISARKWRTLSTLVIGVTLISVNSTPENHTKKHFGREYLIGIACAATQTALSGFASVYFEKTLKAKTKSEPFNV